MENSGYCLPSQTPLRAKLAVNAAVSPAIGVPWRDGLIVADAEVAAAFIQPDSEPRAEGTVIDKDRPTKRIVERALTIVPW